MPANLKNSAVATGLEKVSFYSNPKKDNAKECSNYCTTALISHASKVMFKILQARLKQYMNCELPDVQAGFRKGRGTRDQLANIPWIIKKESSRKTSISALLTTTKPLCGSQQTVEDSEREGNTRPLYTPPKKSVCRSKQQLEPNTEQQTSSKLGKEQVKAVYFTLPI